MSKHTKGPWLEDGNGFAPTWDVSNSERSICTVTTNRQDAQLIAAAPELLEACQRLVDYARAPGKGTLKGAIDMIEAYLPEAIAKATGSSSEGGAK